MDLNTIRVKNNIAQILTSMEYKSDRIIYYWTNYLKHSFRIRYTLKEYGYRTFLELTDEKFPDTEREVYYKCDKSE